MMLSNATKGEVVILSEHSTWDQWYEDTRATVPGQLWKYFDPDSVAVITEPVPPVKPVDDTPLERPEPPQVREAREARNNRKEDIYYKDYSIFTEDERKWDRYHDIEAKLRERIKSTSQQRRTTIRRRKTIDPEKTSANAVATADLEAALLDLEAALLDLA
ncbi:hypothetical protein MMC29_001615 [Sticta canariensis]|nr:hypothetical protein [Sticta canariensis]